MFPSFWYSKNKRFLTKYIHIHICWFILKLNVHNTDLPGVPKTPLKDMCDYFPKRCFLDTLYIVKRGNKIIFRCDLRQLLLNFKLVTILSEIIWTFLSLNWCRRKYLICYAVSNNHPFIFNWPLKLIKYVKTICVKLKLQIRYNLAIRNMINIWSLYQELSV